ncbi:MAG: hypothetical protein O7C67_15560 [Gammaproteobacteria bacterium]|nr:hypothetical protein [Gammaproteobacteria bacterium]
MSRTFTGIVLAGLLWATQAMAGQPLTPPWMEPDVLKAAIDIGMNDEQLPQFRTCITEFVDGRTKALNRLLRGHNVTNMDRKIKSRTNSLKRTMNKRMSEFLTEEQYPRYETYRDLLISKFRF